MKSAKREVEEKIDDFFKNIGNKTPEQVRKIKRLAMRYRIRLGERRKKFCKYCFSPDVRTKSIKNGVKKIYCNHCKKISSYKIKTS